MNINIPRTRHRRLRGGRILPAIAMSLMSLLPLPGILGTISDVRAQISAYHPVGIPRTLLNNVTVESLESKVFELANLERFAKGLGPLAWNEKAALAARSHSGNMASADFLGHEDLLGNNVADRVARYGLDDWRRIGENVAWLTGYDDPAARVVFRWMASPGHRDNMLESKWRETGVGLVVSPKGKYYFTQVFVLRK